MKRLMLLFVLLAVIAQPDACYSASKWALVIGNGAYKEAPLRCPVNDATDMAKSLEGLGFTVAKLINANQQQIENAIRYFGSHVKENDIALFYFSGHGTEVKGINYLIPIGMQASGEDEIKYKAVPAEMVLDKLERAGSTMNIIILDACRTNPFKRFRSVNQGLAELNSPAGTIIAYATAPGTIAFDGVERNSPYTKYLLENIKKPKLEIEDVFKRVRVAVMNDTKKRQIPWESSSLTGDFCFADWQSDSDEAVVYNSRGLAWNKKEDHDKAIENFDKAIQLDPNYARAYSNRGYAWDDKGDYDKAIEDYNKAIQLNPDYARAYNLRGVAWINKGDYDKAFEDYDKAIQLDPGEAAAYNSRGVAWNKKGDYDKAIEDFDKAIQLDPNYARAYSNRGYAWDDKDDYDKAIEDYNKAIQLDPDDARAYILRGVAWSNKDDYDKAIEDYDKAIQLDPDDALAYSNRGDAWNNKGDYDKAIEDYNKAIQLDPDYAPAYSNRGAAWYNKADYDKAIEDFSEAVRLDPDNKTYRQNLSAAMKQKGD